MASCDFSADVKEFRETHVLLFKEKHWLLEGLNLIQFHIIVVLIMQSKVFVHEFIKPRLVLL